MTFDYDLFVIGAGPGGLAASKQAAQLGARVAVAEQEALGGTCVNRGCVPKKLIVYAADFALQNQIARSYGWTKSDSRFDWSEFMKSVYKRIDRINDSYFDQVQKAGIELIKGHATFVDAHTIDISGRRVTADKVLIAVGGHPFKPNIPGIEYAITSRQIFQLPYLPLRLAIIGGGYIGVEFASIMHAFGAEVTVLERDEMILSEFDRDVRTQVQEGLRKRGIQIFGNTSAKEIKLEDSEGLILSLSGECPETITVDSILVATGRTPNTKNLGLAKAGVEVSEKGTIKVDEYSRTTQENIFAVGDCTNRLPLTPVAKAEGIAFVNTVFGNKRQKVDYDYVPSAVFSRPEAASIGMTEEKAREKFGEAVQCCCTQFQPLFYQMTEQNQQATMKLVIDGNSQRILGAHMVGEHAADIIQTLAVAIRKGITKQDIEGTIGIHPTTGEEFLTLD
jgi:glutathione reductase (NADPH)